MGSEEEHAETPEDSEELAAFLTKKGIHKQAVETLRNELVTWASLSMMTDDRLRQMGLKFGPIQELRTLINSIGKEAPENSSVRDSSNLDQGIAVSAPAKKIKKEIHSLLEQESCNRNEIDKHVQGTETQYPTENGGELGVEEYIDVRSLVKAHDKRVEKKHRIEKALDSGIVSRIQRNALVREVCDELVRIAPGKKYYPDPPYKILAAKSIIHAFPKEALPKNISKIPWVQYYEPKKAEGLIGFRLKTMRKQNLKPDEKMRNVAPKGSTTGESPKASNDCGQLLSEDVYQAKVSRLSLMRLQGNKAEIFKLMNETRPNRVRWVLSSSGDGPAYVTDIFRKFNKFKFFKGELILLEFKNMFRNIDHGRLLEIFPSFYAPRIIYYCWKLHKGFFEKTRNIHDKNLRALVLLSAILPSPNYMKNSPDSVIQYEDELHENRPSVAAPAFSSEKLPNENLIKFVDTNDNLMKSTIDKNAKGPVQPYMICATSGPDSMEQFFVRADNVEIKVSAKCIKAFDVLLKLHYCFDVKFAPDLRIFYNFICAIIMNMENIKKCPASVTLDTSLRNINDSHLLESDYIEDCSFGNENEYIDSEDNDDEIEDRDEEEIDDGKENDNSNYV